MEVHAHTHTPRKKWTHYFHPYNFKDQRLEKNEISKQN
jgi:hypothetical protein